LERKDGQPAGKKKKSEGGKRNSKKEVNGVHPCKLVKISGGARVENRTSNVDYSEKENLTEYQGDKEEDALLN